MVTTANPLQDRAKGRKLVRHLLVYALTAACASLILAASPASAQAARNYDCSKPGNANKVACKARAAPAAAPAKAARNYDCSKAGNANKAACKTAAAPASPQAAPAAAPAKAARNYDCSKAGNANKAACKTAATPAPPQTAPAAAPAKAARNYDCSKPGNADKTACKGAPAAGPAMPAAAGPAKPPSPMATTKAPVAPQAGKPTAQCKDGSYSMSQHRSGTCSRHGGVANWLATLP
jgi:large subunit ribosomal protein L22e/Meckel syndrome type 1 protein